MSNPWPCCSHCPCVVSRPGHSAPCGQVHCPASRVAVAAAVSSVRR